MISLKPKEIDAIIAEISNNIPKLGYKAAYHLAFYKLGIGAEVIVFDPDSSIEEIRSQLQRAKFDWEKKVIIRFSHNKDINLPRAANITSLDEAIAFIQGKKLPNYSVLVGPAGTIKNAYEVYYHNSYMFICILPGKWEISTTEATDLIYKSQKERIIYRYTKPRSVLVFDEISSVQPFTFGDLESRSEYFESIEHILQRFQKSDRPVFMRCSEDLDGRIEFSNFRVTERLNLTYIMRNKQTRPVGGLFDISSIEDLSAWDGNLPLLFTATSSREEGYKIFELARALVERGIKEVYCNSILSHQAIILREMGIRVLQNIQDYEKRVSLLSSHPARCKRFVPPVSPSHVKGQRAPDGVSDLHDTHIIEAVTEIGNKARNLKILAKHGFPIADGFVIDSSAIRREAQKVISNAYRYAKSKYPSETRFVVRSSGISEDSFRTSAAGLYLSLLAVPLNNLEQAIYRVIDHSIQVTTRMQEIAPSLNSTKPIAILIQKMLAMDIGGVAFSQDFNQHSVNKVLIEACYGLCNALVNHEVWPERYEVTPELYTYIVAQHKQDFKYVVSDDNSIRKIALRRSEMTSQILSNQQLFCLATAVREVETIFGFPQDIEFALLGRSFFFLQARPISITQNE